MTEKDKKLILEAWNLNCIDWYKINDLILQADSQEAKNQLKFIQIYKYEREAYSG